MSNMIVFTSVVSAFLTGLLGSVHCIGMCGGIAGTLTMQLLPEIRQSPLRLFPYLLTYNLGRIASYTFAGLLIGGLGSSFTAVLPEPHKVSIYISGGFMIALGIYLGSWWPTLAWLEQLGAKLWRRIEPLGRRFFPIDTHWKMLGVGAVWGWLPCGLVYTALVLALSASLDQGGPTRAALLMFSFGLGTLPTLIATGSVAYWLTKFTRHLWVRRAAGILAIGFGLYLIVIPYTDHAQHHHNMLNSDSHFVGHI
ncbi:Sulfite exporter TauE/SafE family protein [Gammaproteobacteria bacterium]